MLSLSMCLLRSLWDHLALTKYFEFFLLACHTTGLSTTQVPLRGERVIYYFFVNFFIFKNGPTPASFSFIFSFFKQTSLQFLQQIYVKKYPSSIRSWDSNTRPLARESLPITSRPGLPPIFCYSMIYVYGLTFHI